ncbi:hypothetical protein HPB49_008594 [Dermacentor silvarum]|uniref:Uncharacterized protein n=1 Tax=Dermacentor silvarum TaxID=543639 RepID=A0ACB8DXQ5_DERSI|nr:hypothetical protein HPB49_008594 [Dermacentor silvarum]
MPAATSADRVATWPAEMVPAAYSVDNFEPRPVQELVCTIDGRGNKYGLVSHLACLPPTLWITEDVATLSQSLQKPNAEGQAFSASLLPPGVPDSDVGDLDKPQMCAQHSQEIFDYMAYLETKWPLQPKFLRLQTAVSPEMRAILINWMMMVHQRFQLLQETLFLAVSLTDRFVQVQSVSRYKLQLLGVSAIVVAGKFEEMMPSTLGRHHLLKLKRKCCAWSSRSFAHSTAQADIVEHNVVKLVLLPCLLDYPMAWVRPSEQAAAAVCLSLRLFDREDQHMWGALMSHLGCYTEEALQPTIKIMAGLLLDAAKSGHKAPYEKYKHSRMERVCTVIVAHAAKLREMAVRP